MYEDSASVFIDGVGADGTAAATVQLESKMQDNPSSRMALVHIGQRIRGRSSPHLKNIVFSSSHDSVIL